jgi:hypothetical protein
MRKWHIYDLQTGLFTGQVLLSDRAPAPLDSGTEQRREAGDAMPSAPGLELPEGCGAVEWPASVALKTAVRRVNPKTGEVEAFRPAAPADDELRTWAWDEATEQHLPVPTETALKLQRVRELQVQLEQNERAQDRPQRELLLALAAGKAVPPEAVAKLSEIEATAATLRAEMAATTKR